MSTGRIIVAKKSSASSRPGRLKSTKSEDIENRRWTEQERQTVRRVAGRQAAGDDSAAQGGGERTPGRASPRLAEVQGRRPPDPHQRHLDESDGGGAAGAATSRLVFIEDPLSEALIQGSLPRQADIQRCTGPIIRAVRCDVQ
jgi:hypothetical protein